MGIQKDVSKTYGSTADHRLEHAVSGSGAKPDRPPQKVTAIVIYASLLSATGSLLFGYDTGITSGSMIYIREQFTLSSIWEEVIISITLFSAAAFSGLSGPASTRYGRKFVILSASFVFTIGSFIMAFANERIQLLVGRLVIGAGIGFTATNVPLYIAEVAPIKWRGSLLALNFVFIVSGQLLAAIIAGLLTNLPDNVSWRWMLGIAAAPAAIQFLGFIFMPESPRWLIQKGRHEKAIEVLKHLRGTDQVMSEFLDIRTECEESQSQGTLCQAFGPNGCRKALLVVSVLWATHELSGINTLMYYTATMVQMSGVFDKSQAVWYAAGISTFYVAFSTSGVYLVEKIGRRKLLLFSIAGVVSSLVLIGAGFMINDLTGPTTNVSIAGEGICSKYMTCGDCNKYSGCGFCFSPENSIPGFCLKAAEGDDGQTMSHDSYCSNGTIVTPSKTIVWAKDWCPSPYSYIVLIGMTCFLISFGPGLGAMSHTLTAEVFPLEFRAASTAFLLTFNWTLNALVALSFLTMTETIGKPATFWIYGAITSTGGLFLFFTVPETRGKSMEETTRLFSGG